MGLNQVRYLSFSITPALRAHDLPARPNTYSQDVLYYISLPQPVQAIYSTRPGKTLEAQQQVLSRFSLLYWYYTALSRPGISNGASLPSPPFLW